MKILRTIFIMLLAATSFSLRAMTDVTWNVVENCENGGKYTYIQRFTVKNHDGIYRLCFNMFARKMEALNPADKVVEVIPGYYYIESSRFGSDGDITIDLRTSGWIQSCNYAPDGLHGVKENGELVPVRYHRTSLLVSPELRNRPGRDVMTYADSIYRFNETLVDDEPLSPYDIVPSFKNVKLTEGIYEGVGANISTEIIENENPEFYRIIVMPDSIAIQGATENICNMARSIVLWQLIPNGNGKLPCAVIEDYPDFRYRGLMIDVARNFLPLSQVQSIVYKMVSLRMNRLHFHIVDDEAWRLEIPGLPELTSVGARRGYTTDEKDFLAQIFAGDGNPNSTEGTANGYIMRDEFIDFLKFCYNLGVQVIPEIESPGHARAAIKSMEARYRNTGDDTYLLREFGDTSVYTSAQSFHDNIMNPALPGPYKFMEKVIDEIAAMYREAGVPLPGIHIGGDEVPEGSWDGSPAAQKMMKKLGISGRHLMQGEFVRRIAAMMKEKGITMYGWQEVGVGYDDEFNREVAPATGGVNCWLTNSSKMKSVPLKAVRSGFPVILSNVEHFYMDQLYASHPEERGLYWGGVVDEFAALGGYPYELCPVEENERNLILGVQGQLFGETLRSEADAQRLLYPKIYGLAERQWNAEQTYTNARLNHIIGTYVLPRMALGGQTFHLRAPGIIVENGKIKMNCAYPDATIRYTLNGEEPTENSPLYEGEIDAGNVKEIRAAMYYLGSRSLTSLLYVK